MNEIEAKRKELDKPSTRRSLIFFNMGVEMARKERIHSSNLSSDFQDGYNKACKEFLDKIKELESEEYYKNCPHCKVLEELKQSLSGEKHE